MPPKEPLSLNCISVLLPSGFALTVVNESAPLPSVTTTWPAEPSAVGSAYALLIVVALPCTLKTSLVLSASYTLNIGSLLLLLSRMRTWVAVPFECLRSNDEPEN